MIEPAAPRNTTAFRDRPLGAPVGGAPVSARHLGGCVQPVVSETHDTSPPAGATDPVTAPTAPGASCRPVGLSPYRGEPGGRGPTVPAPAEIAHEEAAAPAATNDAVAPGRATAS